MKLFSGFLTALAIANLPLSAKPINPPVDGPPSPTKDTCGDEDENKDSWAWSLDIGKAEFVSSNDLLQYATAGAKEGSIRGGSVRTFQDIYSAFNGGSSSKQAVVIYFDEKTVSAAIADPAILKIDDAQTTADVIRVNGVIRQVFTDSVLTDVTPLANGSGYTLKTWFVNSETEPDISNDLYVLPVEPPFYTVTFSNPDHPADNHRIDKTFLDQTGNSTRTITTRYEETYLPAPNSDHPKDFTITSYEGPQATGTPLHKEFIQYSNRGTGSGSGPAAPGIRRYWDYDIERTISEATLSPTGAIGSLEVISHTYEEFADFSIYTGTTEPDKGGEKGARRLVSITRGYGSAETRATTSQYVDEPQDPTVHGRLRSQLNPDGSWDYYEYSGGPNASLRTETHWSSWKNVSMANKDDAQKTITTIEPHKTTTITSIAGVVVARQETILETLPTGELLTTSLQQAGRSWNATVTSRHPQTNNQLTSGRIQWVENPDGTATTYVYDRAPGGYTITRSSGQGSRTGITAGTRTVETYNFADVLLASTSYDIASNLQLTAWVKSDLDNKGRPQRTDYPFDGTYQVTQYSCCGIGFARDRSGATESFLRDPLKRVYRVVAKRSPGGPEIATTTNYDGLTIRTERTSGATTLLASETTRNLAGETILMKSPDADGDGIEESTTIATSYPAGGGKTVTTTYPDSSTSIHTDFADGRPAAISGSAVLHKTFNYGTHVREGSGIWSQAIAANGSEWTKSYSDSLGRTFRSELPDGSYSSRQYYGGKPGSHSTQQDPWPGAPGSYGKLASESDPDGVFTNYHYNAEGDLTKTTEEMPHNQMRITLTQSDVVTDPDIGIAARTTTTVNGVLVSTSLSQALGYASKSVSFGNTSMSTRSVPVDGAWTVISTAPDGTYSKSTYTDGLLKTQEQFGTDDISIVSTSLTYDGFGRVLSQIDSRTGTTIMGTILENGSYLSVADPGGRVTAYTFDVMGRVTTTDLPDTLDADGNTLTNITQSSYTSRGEIAGTWGAQTNPSFRIYDSLGRMSELRTYRTLAAGTQPTAATANADSTTWQYDSQRGFLTAKRDAENKGADYSYTPAGRLLTRTWARSSPANPMITTYTYDAGMLTLTAYSDSTPDVSQTYDHFGRPVETTNTASKTTYSYNPATLLLDTETVEYDVNSDNITELTRVIDRDYDGYLRPNGFDLKNGTTIENSAAYNYSATQGRLRGVGNQHPVDPADPEFTYQYTSNSNLLESVTGPLHTVTNSYEATRNVLSSKENKTGMIVVSDYAYSVNEIGQRTDVSQTGTAFAAARSIAWGYDSLGQVTKADSTIPGLDRAYQYDTIGNRLKSADSLTLPATANYTANALNQYTAIDSVTPDYDADGNAVAYPLPANLSANSTLVWDGENRLISATLPDSTTVSYVYDSQSRRIASTTSAGTTLTIYDGWNPIAEYSTSDFTTLDFKRSYLWGMDLSGSMQGAGGVGGLLAVTQDGSTYYPTFDGNGNVSEYLDSTGAVAAHYEYDPFGRTTIATGTKAQDFSHRFSTKPLDKSTGLYYYGYRYYDPQTGRWPSRDPIEEMGGTNFYGFVGNDTFNKIDLLGREGISFTTIVRIGGKIIGTISNLKCSPAGAKKIKPGSTQYNPCTYEKDGEKCPGCKKVWVVLVCGRDLGKAGNGLPNVRPGQRIVLGVWRKLEEKSEACKKCPKNIS